MRNIMIFSMVGVLALVGAYGCPDTAAANPIRPAVAQAADLNTAANPVSLAQDQWRYRWHNGQWWYYTPSNSWMIHSNGNWGVYNPATYRAWVDPRFSAGYRGNYNGRYYGNGYWYGNRYYPGRSYYSNRYYNNGRYYNGYRGNVNINSGVRTGANIGGVIGGRTGANIGATIGGAIGNR